MDISNTKERLLFKFSNALCGTVETVKLGFRFRKAREWNTK
jgi:hypothetical protein